MLKLGCVNCGAPLEIAADLDVFACAYCGTQQQVKREGGAVALRRVESAIKAVQRGTDRTAAELAMPRLHAELDALQQEKARVLAESSAQVESAQRGRRHLTIFAFFVVLIGGSAVADAVGGFLGSALRLVWLAGCVAVPVFVYRKVKMPQDTNAAIVADIDKRLDHVSAHIRANRSILDQLPI